MGPAKQKAELTQEEIELLSQRGGITKFDNDGNMVYTNRAARRNRPATDPKYTKATHSQKINKIGKKKARK